MNYDHDLGGIYLPYNSGYEQQLIFNLSHLGRIILTIPCESDHDFITEPVDISYED